MSRSSALVRGFRSDVPSKARRASISQREESVSLGHQRRLIAMVKESEMALWHRVNVINGLGANGQQNQGLLPTLCSVTKGGKVVRANVDGDSKPRALAHAVPAAG